MLSFFRWRNVAARASVILTVREANLSLARVAGLGGLNAQPDYSKLDRANSKPSPALILEKSQRAGLVFPPSPSPPYPTACSPAGGTVAPRIPRGPRPPLAGLFREKSFQTIGKGARYFSLLYLLTLPLLEPFRPQNALALCS